MGFFSDTDPGFRQDVTTLPPLPRQDTAGDIAAAAFLRENIVASTINRIANSGTFAPVEGHNPLDSIRSTKYEARHMDAFVGSQSPAEDAAIMRRIDAEEKRDEVLQAAGAGGVLLSMLAGTLDPTLALPASIAVKAGKAGYEFTRAAVGVGAAAAIQVGAQETVLQATQETRPLSESLMNVASGTVLAGLIGGAASRLLAPAERLGLEQALDRARADMDAHANPRPSGVTSTRSESDIVNDVRRIFLDEVAPEQLPDDARSIYDRMPRELKQAGFRAANNDLAGIRSPAGDVIDVLDDEAVAEMKAAQRPDPLYAKFVEYINNEARAIGNQSAAPPLIPEPEPLGLAASVGAAAADTRALEMQSSIPGTSKISPTRRVLSAESTVARRLLADTAETPYSYKQSAQGVAATQGPPVDRIVKMAKDGTQYAINQELDRLFTEYRFGTEPPAFARIRAGIDDLTGAAAGKMDYAEFKRAVSDAWMFGPSTQGIPQVNQAAQFIRDKLEPWTARAEKAVEGFQRLTPDPGENYFPHNWNKAKIKAQRPQFTDQLVQKYREDQATKAAAKQRLEFYNAQLNSWEAQIGKLEARFGRAEERAKRLDARAAERSRDERKLIAGLNEPDPEGRVFDLQRRKVELESEAKELSDMIGMMQEMDGIAIPAIIKRNAEALERRLVSARVEGARLSEAGRQAKRSEKRLAAIEEQLDRAEARKELIEETMGLADQFRNEVRAKIEAELGAWEGKSVSDVKSALKAREKYADAASRDPDAPRLTGADSTVDRAVKRILKSDRDLDDMELRSVAQQTVDRILGSPDGRLPYDVFSADRRTGGTGEQQRGSLARRQLNVSNRWARDWIEDDVEHVVASHLRTFVPDVVLAERFGDAEMSQAFRAVNEDYARLIDGARGNERKITKLGNERDAVIRDLAAIRDRIRHVYGWDPGTANLGRISTMLKVVNNLTNMGMSAIASISDFAGAPIRHGLTTTFNDAWAPFLKSMVAKNEGLEKQKHYLRSLGLGVDTALNLRQHALDDIVDGYRPQSRVERAMQWTNDKFFVANGLAPLTDLQKQLAASVIIPEAIRAAKAIVEGKATKLQIQDMADAGIDAAMASRIHRQIFELKHGDMVDGVMLPNTADWTDQGARLAFDGAVARAVDIAVVTPGQEKPLLMSKPVGSLLLQFKSFPAAATERVLISNLQRRDAKALSGVITSLALGMLSYKINSVLGGTPVSDRPQDWVKEGISRSGLIGWLEEGNAMAAKLTRGTLDVHRLYGADKPLSRYASRSLADSFLGPTAGKLGQIGQVAGATATGEWGESDTRALRRLMFFQNMFWLRNALNGVESSTNSYFNVPQKVQ